MSGILSYRLWRLRRRIVIGTVLSAAPGLLIAPDAPLAVLHAVAMGLFWSWHAVRFPRSHFEPVYFGLCWGVAYAGCAALPILTDKPSHPMLLILFPILLLGVAVLLAAPGQVFNWWTFPVKVRLHGTRASRLSVDALRKGTTADDGHRSDRRDVDADGEDGLLRITNRAPYIDVATGKLEQAEWTTWARDEIATDTVHATIHMAEREAEPVLTVLEYAERGDGSLLTYTETRTWPAENLWAFWLSDGTRDHLTCLCDQAEGRAPRAISLEPDDAMIHAINRLFPSEDPPAPPSDPVNRGPWG
ncbi:hypothetical protein [Jannaschia donghaensis]|uniref:Uncharacterized protein n=1 Tax=Jannaschia donghaensis TaxID=420998 RepID=A0A0M6YI83_9RHOB|nr:hypothetical protein [Jannaschia donghaensis]CTQ49624.1 hypothetical protein JDO7802_01638 [Jannaschia donghaensis]